MNVIRLILDFLFYRWLADKTSANHLQGTSLINSSISFTPIYQILTKLFVDNKTKNIPLL